MRAVALLGAGFGIACTPPVEALPEAAGPALAHPDLAGCRVDEVTAVPGPPVRPVVDLRAEHRYDDRGRLVEVAYDDDGDGVFDRRHALTWGAHAPERREATLTAAPDDRFRVDYRYEHTTRLEETVDERVAGVESARGVRYRYDRGQLIGIDEDLDGDGGVDVTATLEWLDADAHVEVRDDRRTTRSFGVGPRLLTSLEVPTDPAEPSVRVWMTWSADRVERPLQRTVDVGDDGVPDVTTTWDHDCP